MSKIKLADVDIEQKPRTNQLAWLVACVIVLAAGGTALFVGTRTLVSLGWGDAISLVVAVLYATYLLLNRRLVNRYAPFTLTTYAASIAALPILVLTAPSLLQQDWAAVTVGGWLAMAWAIIGPVFVAWSLWNWVLRHLSPVQVAPLLFTVPETSGLAAWIFLDPDTAQPPSPITTR